VSGQLHVPAALPSGKEPAVPIGQEVGWTPQPIWTTWRRENSCPYRDSNSDHSVVQHVASHYTDYAILAPNRQVDKFIVEICYLIGWLLIWQHYHFQNIRTHILMTAS
jgi:hypothetical protein